MPWLILVVAGLLEVVWALMLKQSAGFSKPAPTIAFFVALFFSMFLLSQALKSLPVGTAYAVWTGIGAAGTAILGIVLLGESRDALKILSLLMLIGGIIGLRVASSQ
jgi:quaternary ammonium compound-resistance protein SugE